MACRFPGATSLVEYWSLLSRGLEAFRSVPSDRFSLEDYVDPQRGAPGRLVSREGGFLDDIAGFDADFFGISAREAPLMDPQQRHALEVAYESLEDAGLALDSLAGGRIGVYIGQWSCDYEKILWRHNHDPDLRMIAGAQAALTSGRISHAFDFRGPSLTLDSACASSLVGIHLACQSLQAGECELALAGGVNLVIEPTLTIGFSRSRMLASDSRCKFGDHRADGFVRSDGIGIVVLKPLELAERDGDRIWGVIRGSHVVHDGASAELYQPGVQSQVSLLRGAYQGARLDPQQVHYVECHGTGTNVGDPIELQALGQVVGAGRSSPCRLGSVKSNIGHCEAAAGVASLIKVCLSLYHGFLPPTLQVEKPRDFDWVQAGLQLQTEGSPWPLESGQVATAGISGYGINGSGAHLVVQAAPRPSPPAGGVCPDLLLLSARSPQALEQLVHETEQLSPTQREAVLAASARRRSHHRQRRALVDGQALPESQPGSPPRVLWVFPGQGSQWHGMGRTLYQTQNEFSKAFDACAEALDPHLSGWRLGDMLGWTEEQPLQRLDIVQPALFAIQVSLSRLFRHWGVPVDGVVGHSMGELAAAVVAGCLSLSEAARVIAWRSRLLSQLAGSGGMLLVELDPAALAPYLQEFSSIEVAACNAPRTTVLAGPASALSPLLESLEQDGVFARMVRVDIASHSAQIDPILAQLSQKLGQVDWQPPQREFLSTVAGLGQVAAWDSDYWLANLRQPVHFFQTIEQAWKKGYSHFLEVSAHPILLPALRDTLPAQARLLTSLHRDRAELPSLLTTVGQFYQDGVALHLANLFPDPGPPDGLLRYPWQHQRYWFNITAGHREREQLQPVAGQPGCWTWHRILDPSHPELVQHRLHGVPVVAAAIYLEMSIQAGRQRYSGGPFALNSVRIHEALALTDQAVQIQLTLAGDGHLAIFSRLAEDHQWVRNFSGRLQPLAARAPQMRPPHPAPSCFPEAARYRILQHLGLGLGPLYQGLTQVHRNGVMKARVKANGPAPQIDACLQLLLLQPDGTLPAQLVTPRCIDRINVWSFEKGGGDWQVERDDLDHLTVRDDLGTVLFQVQGLGGDPLTPPPSTLLQQLHWQERPLPARASEGRRGWYCPPGSLATALGLGPERCDYFLYFVDPPAEEVSIADWEKVACAPLIQALRGERPSGRLCLVTFDLFEAAHPQSFLQGQLWGMFSVIVNEFPQLQCLRLDIPSCPDRDCLAAVSRLLDSEPFLTGTFRWHQGKLWQASLGPCVAEPGPVEVAQAPFFQLEIGQPGDLESLQLRSLERLPLLPDQIEIEVAAVGLNFAEVLQALGTYPDESSGCRFGLECCGIITAVGSAVSPERLGQRVMALAPGGCMASHARTSERLAFGVPQGWNDEQAATFLISFLTAAFALESLGQLQPQHTVLIHSASGAVGLAACQLAQQRGCRTFTTVGSPEKLAYLQSSGQTATVCSRDADWADQILALNGGQRVDRVLNTLSGQGWQDSLGLLAPAGVMLDLSKRDIYDNRWCSLQNFARGRGYWAVDLFDLLNEQPQVLATLAEQLLRRAQQGELKPLPTRTMPMDQAALAFRGMSDSAHIGKIALIPPSAAWTPAPKSPLFGADRSYLVTGGAGAIGLRLLDWMHRSGALHLVALGRTRPEVSSEAGQQLQQLGVRFVVCDVSCQQQLAAVIQDLPAPLGGVFHLAGGLADGLAVDLDDSRFRQANSAKLDGAWNLHRLTQDVDLDMFVMFSSFSGTLGLPAQANYAAANAALDGLARQRRQQGLPALSLGWGWWGEVEGLVDSPKRQHQLEQQGIHRMASSQCLALLEGLLRQPGPAVVLALDFDSQYWRDNYPRDLVPEVATTSPRTELPLPQNQPELDQVLRAALETVLGRRSQDLDWTRPLREMGLDSLFSLELRNRLERHLGVRVSASAPWNYPTPEAFSRHLGELLGLESVSPRVASAEPDPWDDLLAEVENLTEEEALLQLGRELDH